MADLIQREETRVMFVRALDGPDAIRRAWERLEARVGPPQGRKFFGTFEAATSEYRACVQIQEHDDPSGLGLESSTLPGGMYLRARLRGEPPEVYEQISPTFAALAQAGLPDATRPSIEFYRRRGEIDLFLPISS